MRPFGAKVRHRLAGRPPHSKATPSRLLPRQITREGRGDPLAIPQFRSNAAPAADTLRGICLLNSTFAKFCVRRVLARRHGIQPRVGMAACFFIPHYAARSLAKRRARVAARGNRCLTTRFIANLHFGHSVVSIANPFATRFRWTNAISEPHDAHWSLCVMTIPSDTKNCRRFMLKGA